MIIKAQSNEDERAVSPVIGVILMVAITVILAAVIGAFVLGIGGDQEQSPQVSLSIQADGDDIVIDHRGGDSLTGTELSISANDVESDTIDDFSAGQDISAQIGDGSTAGETDVDVVVVHEPSDSIVREATVTVDSGDVVGSPADWNQ